MKQIVLTFTIEEANEVLKGLGLLPFNEVNNLIAKIQKQANEQLTPKAEESTTPAE